MARNVFAVDRGVWDHACFEKAPFTEREAWLWLIGAAAWKVTEVRGKYGPVKIGRGQFSFSIRFLGKRFQWDRCRVDRFLKRLVSLDMIRDTDRDSNRDSTRIYSISNYNNFQFASVVDRDSNRDADRDKEEESIKPSPKVIDIIPAWVPLDSWNGYVEMRTRIKAPLTARAKMLELRKLERLRDEGHDPVKVLDKSTSSSWRGLYPLKSEEDNGSRNRTGKRSQADQRVSGFAELMSHINSGRPLP